MPDIRPDASGRVAAEIACYAARTDRRASWYQLVRRYFPDSSYWVWRGEQNSKEKESSK